MGRFISADTIIPHPVNPQSFNRYSYCLNNPLKYIDPSGQVVEINGINVLDIYAAIYSGNYMMMSSIGVAMGSDSTSLIAYGNIRSVDSYLTGILEQSDDVLIRISGQDLGKNGYMAESSGEGLGISLTLNTNKEKGLTLDQHIANTAHELVHDLGKHIDIAKIVGDSQYEENLGDVYAYNICKKLGLSYNSPFVIDMSRASLQQKYANWPPYDTLRSFPINTKTGKTAYSFMSQLWFPVMFSYWGSGGYDLFFDLMQGKC